MIGRVLVAPALVCLLVGGLLGAWGWTQRDASRERMIVQADERAEEEFESLVSGVEGPAFDPHLWACESLLSAAALETPTSTGAYGLPTDPATGEPAPSVTVPPAQLAAELVTMLGPEQVTGIPELDAPEVQAAMAELRAVVVDASAAGRDVRTDPAAIGAGAVLADVVAPRC